MTFTRVIILAACAKHGRRGAAADRYWDVVRRWRRAAAGCRGQAARPARKPDGVTALGRLEPEDGVIRVAGPSHPAVVIGQLFVDDGDPVKAGQTIAILDSYAATKATVAQLEAELHNAEAEWQRNQTLLGEGFVSTSEYEALRDQGRRRCAPSSSAPRAELDLAVVRSPIDGQVLEVHARQGERVGPDGIVELGQTDAMYAIAEVYETDIGRGEASASAPPSPARRCRSRCRARSTASA